MMKVGNEIRLGNVSSNSRGIKKYIALIISILFLFSIFSSLFVPVLTAKDIVLNNPTDIDTGVASSPAVEIVTSTPAGSVVKDDDNDVEEDGDVKDAGVASSPAVEIVSSTPAVSSDRTSNPSVKKTVETPASSVISSDLPANENAQSNKITSKVFNFDEQVDVGENNTIKYLKSNIGNISENQTISVSTTETQEEQSSISSAKTKIEIVEFKASSSKENVELSVKNLKEKPVEVKTNMTTNNDSEIYEYLDIKLTSGETYIGETGIKSMNFTFSVSKSWIQSRGIDKQTVKMMRYHNDTWQELNTTYVNETDTEIRFKAETPGLSIFAVVGNKVVEDSDEIVVETANIPWWMPFTVILASTATLGVVLFKKRFVYKP
jgi:PGF-pre-PGF domain-containing protein